MLLGLFFLGALGIIGFAWTSLLTTNLFAVSGVVGSLVTHGAVFVPGYFRVLN
jgi:hypothetical protein